MTLRAWAWARGAWLALALALVPSVAHAAPEPAVVSGYDPEIGTFVRTADGRWEFNPYAMVQLTHATTGNDTTVKDTGFNVRAAKLIFHGHVYDPALTYHFQLNAGAGRVVAEDMYLHVRATPWFSLLIGQNEVTFNRQHITLEAYQELVERSAVDARFNLQRDIGAMAYFNTPDRTYEATLGLFNGAGQDAVNDETGYLATARLAYNPMGPIRFREADLEGSRAPKLSVAIAGAYNPEKITAAIAPATAPTTARHVAQTVFETTLRYRGLSLTTEAHVRRQAVLPAPHRWDYGAFEQAGYFVVADHLQIVGRVGYIAGSVGKSDTTGEETLGVNYYFHGHRLKVQLDGSRLESHATRSDWRVRTQLEFFL